MRSEIASEIALDHVRYSQVWEDHELLELGLQITDDDDVLSITSSGDNSLALLLAGANSVTSIDMNPAQTALARLKVALIELLEDHADFVAFLGFAPDARRLERYRDQVRPALDEATRAYWDAHEDTIASGVAHCGRLEAHMADWRAEARPTFWSDELIARLFSRMPLEEQRELYIAQARTPEFVGSLLRYFSREMLSSSRSAAQLAHVERRDTGAVFVERFDRAFTTMTTHDNPYLWLLLRGEQPALEHATAYLRPSNWARLRSGILSKLSLETVELEQILTREPAGTFSKVNLSDAFEYMSRELCDQVYATFADNLRDGARLAHWNLLVDRWRPDHLSSRVRRVEPLSDELLARDRAWFYGNFHVEEFSR